MADREDGISDVPAWRRQDWMVGFCCLCKQSVFATDEYSWNFTHNTPMHDRCLRHMRRTLQSATAELLESKGDADGKEKGQAPEEEV
jgi:hypothetical protein